MPSRKRRFLATILGLAFALALIGWLFRPPRPHYAVADIGVLPGAALSSASGLNNRGDVVGLSGSERRDLQHGFLYRNGGLIDLGRFEMIGSHGGPAINDSGQITGTVYLSATRQNHAFLYDACGMHDLGTPPGDSTSLGNGINGRDQIAVDAWARGSGPGAFVDHSFLYAGGRMKDIGAPPGCTDVSSAGINAAGQIVGRCRRSMGGWQAFVYDSRTQKMTPLAAPPGLKSYAAGINNQAQIIGSLVLPHEMEHAALWAGGRVTDLGTLPGTDSANGEAINNAGVAVGATWTQPNALGRLVGDHPIRFGMLTPWAQPNVTECAFVYQNGRMQDLNALISGQSSWVLEAAEGINDRGQIVGRGLHHGQERAFLLTPVR